MASLIKHKRNFAAYFPISLLGEICKDKKGDEDQYVKDQAINASKIVFIKHSACWLVHNPDYQPFPAEVLITTEHTQHHIDNYTTSDINDETIIAYCLKIMKKSVDEFEKWITRSMLIGKPKSSNQISKKTQVLYRDLPKISPIEAWRGIQLHKQKIPTMIQKYIIENYKSLPQGITAVKITKKGTPKIIVPINYQKTISSKDALRALAPRYQWYEPSTFKKLLLA